jgi:hypothetical protein
MWFVDSVMAWGAETLLRLPAAFWSALPYAGAVLGVAAGAVIAQGLWGARRGWQPSCRRCAHDLRSADRGSLTCPECGADLAKAGAVDAGARRVRPALVVTGVLLLAGAFAAQAWLRSAGALRRELADRVPASTLLQLACEPGSSAEFYQQALESRVLRARGASSMGMLDQALEILAVDPAEDGAGAAAVQDRLGSLASVVLASFTREEVEALAARAAEEMLASDGERQRILDFVLGAGNGRSSNPADFRQRLGEALGGTDEGRRLLAPRPTVVRDAEVGGRIEVVFQSILSRGDTGRGMSGRGMPEGGSSHTVIVGRAVATGADGVARELMEITESGPGRLGREESVRGFLADLPTGEYTLDITGVLAPTVLLPRRDPFGEEPWITAEAAAKLDGASAYSGRAKMKVVRSAVPSVEFATGGESIARLRAEFASVRISARDGLGASVRVEGLSARGNGAGAGGGATTGGDLILSYAVEVQQGGISRSIGSFRKHQGGTSTSGLQLPREIDAGKPFRLAFRPSASGALELQRLGQRSWSAPVAWAAFALDFESGTSAPTVTDLPLDATPAVAEPVARAEAEAMLREYAESLWGGRSASAASERGWRVSLQPSIIRDGAVAPMPPFCGRFEAFVDGALAAPVIRACVAGDTAARIGEFDLVRQPAPDGVVVVRYTPEPELGEALLRGRFRYIAEPFELRFSKSGRPTIELTAK